MPEKVRPEKLATSEPLDKPAKLDKTAKLDKASSATTDDPQASKGATAVKRSAAAASAATKDRGESAPATKAAAKVKRTDIGDRSWVPWVFVPVGLIGVAWLVVYYIVGDFVPGITGGWNILIGMGCMAAAFAIATLWK